MEINIKNIILWLIVIAVVVFGIYSFTHKTKENSAVVKKEIVPATVPAFSEMPTSTQGLSVEAQGKLALLSTWVEVKVANQPTLSKNPNTVKLPAGWTAREDYLSSVVPNTLPKNILNYRSVIMRPIKSFSREDAIYAVPEMTDPYFKEHCHTGSSIVCYGGKNPETKDTFNLMFYFSK